MSGIIPSKVVRMTRELTVSRQTSLPFGRKMNSQPVHQDDLAEPANEPQSGGGGWGSLHVSLKRQVSRLAFPQPPSRRALGHLNCSPRLTGAR